MSILNGARTTAFFLGTAALLGMVCAGAAYSLRASRQLPPVNLQYDTAINALAARKDYRRAIEQAEMALALHDSRLDKVQAYKSLTDWCAVSGDIEQSARYCRLALELREDDPDQHLMMGKLLEHQSKWDDAIDEYQRVLDLNAHSADAHARLGAVFERRRQLDTAAEHYQAALLIDPANATARQGAARLAGRARIGR